jgi:hypothetical protein
MLKRLIGGCGGGLYFGRSEKAKTVEFHFENAETGDKRSARNSLSLPFPFL